MRKKPTQAEVAAYFGLSDRTIRNWKNGDTGERRRYKALLDYYNKESDMKVIGSYDSGVFKAREILSLPHEDVAEICGNKVIKVTEPFKVFDGNEIYEMGNTLFIISDGIAYPFDTPFYEGDEDEGIALQEMPEDCDDVRGLIEGFGRTGLFHEWLEERV